jgi:hypothetical protein
MKTKLLMIVAASVVISAAEPSPRKPSGAAVKTSSPLPYISGVVELSNGRLLISDHKTPRLSLLTTATGIITPVGSPGSNPGQYVRPGGFYGTPEHGLWLLDRGLTRVSAVSTAGELSNSKSILPRGSSGSSDADYDSQHLDARGMAYYFDREARLGGTGAGTTAPMVDLIRFDPATQQRNVIARLQQRITQTMPGGDGMTFSRQMIGSPADGWGVAADGRVAVVRANPYRVDWYSSAGAETKGPAYQVDVLPMTEADKQTFIAANSGNSVSVGMAGAAASSAAGNLLFAETKAPFEGDHVMVSPTGRVFVPRTVPAGVTDVIYDVFDGRGQRVDRILLPPSSRIVGFAARSIYVRESAAPAGVTLKKYEVK